MVAEESSSRCASCRVAASIGESRVVSVVRSVPASTSRATSGLHVDGVHRDGAHLDQQVVRPGGEDVELDVGQDVDRAARARDDGPVRVGEVHAPTVGPSLP